MDRGALDRHITGNYGEDQFCYNGPEDDGQDRTRISPMPSITRPALRWFGGKWRLAPWIIEHFPPHDAYLEPYGGAGSVLLRKPPAKLETWNDLHGRLVNFFRVLREQPDELIAALQLTPYAKEEYELARSCSANPVEDARRFYVLGAQTRAGAAGDHDTGRAAGWRYNIATTGPHGGKYPAPEFANLEHLSAIAARFRHVQVEQDRATAVLERYDLPETLHYVDPPYCNPDADLRRRYAFPMTDAEHVELSEVLHACRGMVVLSGCPSPLYDKLYGDWRRIDYQARNNLAEMSTESLWLNPAAAAAVPQGSLW